MLIGWLVVLCIGEYDWILFKGFIVKECQVRATALVTQTGAIAVLLCML